MIAQRRECTCDLAHDCLRDPAIVEESFDLLLHQVAVSPVKVIKAYDDIRNIILWLKHQHRLSLTLSTDIFLRIPEHLT